MSGKKKLIIALISLMVLLAISDVYRYVKPYGDAIKTVQKPSTFDVANGTEMFLVYNAWGGIYPAVADFAHKELFPRTYPCNLCYITFGTFSMKKEWSRFLDSLPYQITPLHKDNFRKRFLPQDLQLPVVLLGNAKEVQLLFSAEELNQFKNVDQLIEATKRKLNLK